MTTSIRFCLLSAICAAASGFAATAPMAFAQQSESGPAPTRITDVSSTAKPDEEPTRETKNAAAALAEKFSGGLAAPHAEPDQLSTEQTEQSRTPLTDSSFERAAVATDPPAIMAAISHSARIVSERAAYRAERRAIRNSERRKAREAKIREYKSANGKTKNARRDDAYKPAAPNNQNRQRETPPATSSDGTTEKQPGLIAKIFNPFLWSWPGSQPDAAAAAVGTKTDDVRSALQSDGR